MYYYLLRSPTFAKNNIEKNVKERVLFKNYKERFECLLHLWNFVLYALCNSEAVKWFKMRSNVKEFWSFCDCMSSIVKNELKPIELLTADVEIKRVIVV